MNHIIVPHSILITKLDSKTFARSKSLPSTFQPGFMSSLKQIVNQATLSLRLYKAH